MNAYRYRVTVEQVADAQGQPLATEAKPLQFEAACHDDLLEIVQRVRVKGLVPDDDAAAAMAVGLKLFTEVAIMERCDPMFAAVLAALGTFIREMKAR